MLIYYIVKALAACETECFSFSVVFYLLLFTKNPENTRKCLVLSTQE